jgi:hypothetical protein
LTEIYLQQHIVLLGNVNVIRYCTPCFQHAFRISPSGAGAIKSYCRKAEIFCEGAEERRSGEVEDILNINPKGENTTKVPIYLEHGFQRNEEDQVGTV